MQRLNHAVCRGNLVIAAAGHRGTSVDDNAGLMYPAAFEAEAAWSCDQRLANSVGALDLEDNDASVTRDRGQPRLAAYAEHLSSRDGSQPANSGTSYAAATVSGTAALVWAHASHFSAARVLESIYDSGVSLGRPATACVGAGVLTFVDRARVKPSTKRSSHVRFVHQLPALPYLRVPGWS